jgi:four helix bundle protein
MQNYKELKVWEKAHSFTLEIYQVTNVFPKEEIYGLTSQMRRAAASIPVNIAEGCGRNSNLELANFLQISLGSSNEIEYDLLLAKDLDYLSEPKYSELNNLIGEIRAMLLSLIQKVRNKPFKS